MAATWEAWTALATAAGAIFAALGFGLKNAHSGGARDERMKDMGKTLHAHETILAEHTAKLAQGDGDFKVIDTKLDYITKAVEAMDVKLTRHCEADGK